MLTILTMVYRPPTYDIVTPLYMVFYPLPMALDSSNHGISSLLPTGYRPLTHNILTHGILTPLSMLYRIPYSWYIDPLTHGISTPIHNISTPLPMVYRPLYPWNIDPLTHGISNTYPWYIYFLPMVY
jgi:hypothetical protein